MLSFLYGPTLTSIHDYWKTIALTRRLLLVGRVMSLLFNMLSRLAITSLPRSKHLLVSRLQSPSAVTLEPKTRNSVTASTVPSSLCHEVTGLEAMSNFQVSPPPSGCRHLDACLSPRSVSSPHVPQPLVVCVLSLTVTSDSFLTP